MKATRSVYVIGGAGTGKSTFTAALLDRMGWFWHGSLVDLHTVPNARSSRITLRGHWLVEGEALYLGVMRERFPGTDGLDRASSIAGAAWLEAGGLSEVVVAEGSTLATRRFLGALHRRTDLLLVHLLADEFVKELRFAERRSDQDSRFVGASATRAANLLADMAAAEVRHVNVNTADRAEWGAALERCAEHLAPRTSER